MDNIIIQTLVAHPEAFIKWLLAAGFLLAGAVTAGIKLYKGIEKYRKLRNSQEEKDELIQALEDNQEKLRLSVDIMSISIRNIIKTHIVREYNYFTRLGWIDIYSLDCVERLYQSYSELDGNTYICDLVSKLRDLPNTCTADNEIS